MMKLMELNTNKPECVVIAEEPLITLEYFDKNKKKLLDIFASDLRNCNVGDIFQFECDSEFPHYEEKLIIVFKNADGCAGVLKRFDVPDDKSDEQYYDEIFWFQLHNNNQEHTDSMCVEEKVSRSILQGDLKINELCFADRTGNHFYYISSLRYCLNIKNKEEYNQSIELLQSDIEHLPAGKHKDVLISVYNKYENYERCSQLRMI